MAVVFNIQRFCVHDGPGIRTTVFLKGCGLSCEWCHNPESISKKIQMQYFAEKCTECGMCASVCSRGVYVQGKKRINQNCCVLCGRCVDMCMYGALKMAGQRMQPQQVMEIVRKDKDYYDSSGGGVTVSGGEPLLWPSFCEELFRAAKDEGIHTALDTSAYVSYAAFEKVLPYTDAILLDIKVMDSEIHKKYTGAPNELVLENARRLFGEDVDIYIRIPVIGGVNDIADNMRRTAEFLRGRENVKEIRLLPYHSLGEDKANSIGMKPNRFDSPTKEQLDRLSREFDRPVEY